jgi:hypothetical protein
MTKGEETQNIIVRGAIRLLPGGACEYCFPKEYLDTVLNSLKFDVDDGDRYGLGKFKLALLRKVLKAKKTPKFEKEKKLVFFDDEITENVNIIAIGIREDGEITEPKGSKYEDFKHEAI